MLSLPACGEDAAQSDNRSDNGSAIPVDSANASEPGSTGSTTSPSTATTGGTTTPPAQQDVDFATKTMTFNGLTRTYMLGTPRGYDAKKSYPVVMLFHGNPGSIAQMRGFAPFETVSKREAFLVYPAASDGSWDLYTPTDSNKDMGFIRALPGELAKSVNIDESKVYGFGFSGGAFMMAQMACRFGQSTFHAVMINSGGGPQEQQMGYSQRDNKCYECPGGPDPDDRGSRRRRRHGREDERRVHRAVHGRHERLPRLPEDLDEPVAVPDRPGLREVDRVVPHPGHGPSGVGPVDVGSVELLPRELDLRRGDDDVRIGQHVGDADHAHLEAEALEDGGPFAVVAVEEGLFPADHQAVEEARELDARTRARS